MQHRCEDQDCIYLGQRTSPGCKCHRTSEQMMAARIEALEFEVEHERYNVEKTAQEAAKRIKALEAALREISDLRYRDMDGGMMAYAMSRVARAALAPERGFSGEDAAFTARHGGGTVAAKIEPPSEEAMDREFSHRAAITLEQDK